MLSGVTVISAWIGSMSPNSASSTTRRQRAEHETEHDAHGRHRQHLGEEDAEHHAAGRADALHGGDHLAALVDERRHRIGDADAADEQRRQADEGQELPQPLQRAAHLRGGIAPVGDGEPGLGQLRFDLLPQLPSSLSLASASPVFTA